MVRLLQLCWESLAELAPWLVAGAVLAGLLRWLLSPRMVQRAFRGWRGVVQAVAWGIPLPLCSCSVIPAGIGLRRQGASDGAAMAFLISTPQTGVDSILVSGSVLGWPFAVLKVLMAAATGLVGGWLLEAIGDRRRRKSPAASGGALPVVSAPVSGRRPSFREAAVHALSVLRAVWVWLLAGVVVSAVIQLYLPPAWMEGLRGRGTVVPMLAVLLFSLPLYVCATASVPVAAGLVGAGLPMAAAFVFLFAGPATNVATMGAIAGEFGRRALAVYLATMIGGGLLGGLMVDWMQLVVPAVVPHVHGHSGWWRDGAAVLLLLLFARFAWQALARWRRAGTGQGAADSGSAVRRLLQVHGMHCEGCADQLRAALRRVPGVRVSAIDVERGTVEYSGVAAAGEIEGAVRASGFTVVGPANGGGDPECDRAGTPESAP